MIASRLRAPTVVATLALAVAACTSAPSPDVPDPSGKAADACRALHRELPEKAGGQQRTQTDPESPYTAAWGDPAIELRCGVPRPDKLTPGSEHYNPTSEAAEVNGVSWLIEQQEGGHRFTTTERAAYIEVSVPDAHAPEIGVLTDFAAAIKETVPKEPGQHQHH